MVLPRIFREQLENLGESPPCLWEEELRKGINTVLSSEDVVTTLPYHGWAGFSPFGYIFLRDASRIESVNQYFRVKAGQVSGNAKALEILSELRSRQVIPRDEWEQFDINQTAVTLAMLSAAGFCEVDDYSISITDEGKQFLDDILE